MIQRSRFLLVLIGLTFFSISPDAGAQVHSSAVARDSSIGVISSPYGPGSIYAKIPARDEFGRDQLRMFQEWNPDPVGTHQANLQALKPMLAKVVLKAQADNPGERFVIGSGKRDGRLQRMAVAWGWSRTHDSPHRSGDAVDLWPLDQEGRVIFDRTAQNRVALAMKKAAAELSVPIRWGGHFSSFKNADRSHFELVEP